MVKGFARGDDKTPMIFGRVNVNYKGPQKASAEHTGVSGGIDDIKSEIESSHGNKQAQNTRPVTKYIVDNRPSSVGRFARGTDYEDFYDDSPEYQRGLVWGEERKKNLIRSLLLGIPIGSIIVNNRMENDENFDTDHEYGVIDGKQRINALRSFVKGDYAIPVSWLEDDAVPQGWDKDTITYTDTTKAFQRSFLTLSIPTSEFTVPTIEDEAEVFNLVNYGGVPQGEKD